MSQSAKRRQSAIVASGEAHPPKLLDRVRAAIRARHYSLRTEGAYAGWICRFVLFRNKRHPSQMGAAEIIQFLTHLPVSRDVSASTQNLTGAAISRDIKLLQRPPAGELGR